MADFTNPLSPERTRKDFENWRSIGYNQSAWYAYERNHYNEETDYEPHVIKDCPRKDWTRPRAELVEIARKSNFFVPTNFVFPNGDDITIASKVEDICLSDMIDGTIPMTEDHASAILTQVVGGLHELDRHSIKYNSLKASRVFVSGKGVVHLVNYAPSLHPEYLVSSENSDSIDVAKLAHHILFKEVPTQLSQVLRQKRLIRSGNRDICLRPDMSPQLVDFFEACNRCDIGLLVNVSGTKRKSADCTDPIRPAHLFGEKRTMFDTACVARCANLGPAIDDTKICGLSTYRSHEVLTSTPYRVRRRVSEL